jgi:hypothetical protein
MSASPLSGEGRTREALGEGLSRDPARSPTALTWTLRQGLKR